MAHPPLEPPVKRVRFVPSNIEVEVDGGTELFDAIHNADLPIASSCGAQGACGKCGIRILSGSVSEQTPREVRLKKANRVAPELRLSCLAYAESDLIITTDYW